MDTTSSSEQNGQPVSEIAQQWADRINAIPADIWERGTRTPAPDWREIAHTAVTEHRAIQHSTELAFLLTVAHDARVKTVLEIGTYAGGTAWAFGQLPSVRRIVTVDRDAQAEAYSMVAALAPKAAMISGRSEWAATTQAVIEALDGTPPNLLLIDGGHDLESVTADFRVYGPLVRAGGLIALHNVELPYDQPSSGPSLLWATIRTAYPSVKITAAPGEWAGIGLIWR